jgi:3-deoxy-7-phosphoheptulonate synthase
MIIVLKPDTTKAQADEILAKIESMGLKSLYMPGVERTVLGAIGDERILGQLRLESHPQVESVKPILAPYKLVSRDIHPHDSIVDIGTASVGGGRFLCVGGPCAVESYEQTLDTRAPSRRAAPTRSAAALSSRGPARTPSRASASKG